MERTEPAAAPALLEMYRAMVLVREVEQALVRLFAENRVPGFLHSYIGEEATAVGVCSALRKDDYITSTHRGHGHIVAKGADLGRIFAEIYGKEAGYCKGKGGSMHVADSRSASSARTASSGAASPSPPVRHSPRSCAASTRWRSPSSATGPPTSAPSTRR